MPSPSLDFGYSDDFFETMSKIRFMTEIVDNLHFIKVKNLCSVKVTVKRMGRQATSQKNIFANDTSDKGPLSKIYKEGLKLNIVNVNHPQISMSTLKFLNLISMTPLSFSFG